MNFRAAVAPQISSPMGPQKLSFRDRRFSGTGKSPIDKLVAREFQTKNRRDVRLLEPPASGGNGAGRSPCVVALS